MSRPTHADEHQSLMTLVMKSINVPGSLIDGVLLVTIGKDGRPNITTNVENPAYAFALMQALIDAAPHVENVHRHELPEDN